MDKGTMRLKVSRTRAEGLYRLYDWLIGVYVPENNHEHLLYAHVVGMYWRIETMLLKDGWVNKWLILTESEAMAFCLIWGDRDLVHDAYGNVIICEMIKVIDQRAKQLKNG